MPQPKRKIPETLDWCDCVLFPVPIALIPIVGGCLSPLEWSASWEQGSADDGYQIAVELQRRLIMSECENSIAEAIDALVSCVCRLADTVQTSSGIPTIAPPAGWPEYEESATVNVVGVGDPPGEFSTWEQWEYFRCQAVQFSLDSANSLCVVVQDAVAGGSVIGWTLLFAALLALGVIAPLVAVLAVVALLVTRAMAIDWQAQRDWLTDNAQNLLCAILTAESALEARMNVDAVFNSSWDDETLGPPDLVRLVYGQTMLNRIFDGTLELPPSTVYNPENCENCDPDPEGTVCFMPVDPDAFYGDFYTGSNVNGVFMGFGGGAFPDCTYPSAHSRQDYIATFPGDYQIHASWSWFSGYGTDATCGTLSCEGYNAVTDEWQLLHSLTAVTRNVAGTVYGDSVLSSVIDLTDFSRFRVSIAYQPGACRSEPDLALNVHHFCFEFIPDE